MTHVESLGRAAIAMQEAIMSMEAISPHLGIFQRSETHPHYQQIARLKRLLAVWRAEVRNLEQTGASQ